MGFAHWEVSHYRSRENFVAPSTRFRAKGQAKFSEKNPFVLSPSQHDPFFPAARREISPARPARRLTIARHARKISPQTRCPRAALPPFTIVTFGFWLSLFISNIGTWMQMTATNWLLYELTDSPLQLGLNGVFRAAPAVALG
jgi:hypothetical protein